MIGLGCCCEMNSDDDDLEGGSNILQGYKYEGSVNNITRVDSVGSGFSAGGFSAGAKKQYKSTGRPRGRPRKLKGGVSLEELQQGKQALKKKVDIPKEEIKKEGVEGLVEELKKGVKLRPKKDVEKIEKPKVGREKLIDEIKKGVSLKPSKPISVEIIKEEIIKDKPQTSQKRKFKILPVVENIPMKVDAMGKPKRKRTLKGEDGVRLDAGIDVGVEDLEEVAEALGLGLEAERGEVLQRLVVPVDVVGEGDRVEPEVGAGVRRGAVGLHAPVLHVLDRRGAESARGQAGVFAAAHDPDVAGVVGARRGRDRRAGEQFLADRELLHVRGGEQHDVDDVLLDDGADLVPVVGERLPAGLRLVGAARQAGARSRGGHAERHVGVLRVGDDEVLAGGGACAHAGNLLVESLGGGHGGDVG